MNHAPMQSAAFRQMAANDLTGGAVTYAGKSYPCTVGTFRIQQLLTPGGLSPVLIGDIQIAAADVGAVEFKTGQRITVTPKIGAARSCKIEELVPAGAIVHITLRDVNQGA